jgi:hypothetical protein
MGPTPHSAEPQPDRAPYRPRGRPRAPRLPARRAHRLDPRRRARAPARAPGSPAITAAMPGDAEGYRLARVTLNEAGDPGIADPVDELDAETVARVLESDRHGQLFSGDVIRRLKEVPGTAVGQGDHDNVVTICS